MLQQAPSDFKFELFRRWLQAAALAANVRARAYNWTLGRARGDRVELTEAAVPPNAPRLIRFLFDVHGEELFELGQFNADPHPGNIMCTRRGIDSSE